MENNAEKLRCEKPTNGDKNIPEGYCSRSFDGILCWPQTPPGTKIYQSCFEEFQGIQYDSSQNATRWCNESGHWNRTNYEACNELVMEYYDFSSEIFLIGYLCSLVVLIIAVTIFLVYRELHCLRNAIHTNLMCTYILVSISWVTMWLINYIEGFRDVPWLCNGIYVVLNFATLTNFFWMFVEGMYLYMLVVQTFTIENIRYRIYLLVGWGAPVPIITLWAITKTYEFQGFEDIVPPYNQHCLLMQPNASADTAFLVWPILIVLAVNCTFLIRIMWVLITKLRSANSAETQQYRKAAKALLVLFPLLGITYVLTVRIPFTGITAVYTQWVRDTLIATQGLVVSVFYCFFNSEVRAVLRHTFRVFRENRSIGNKRQRFAGSKESPYVGVENVRLFGNQEGSGHARYHKRESGASDMTTVTYVGYSSSSNGRCRSLSGSTVGTMGASIKAGILNNVPNTNCV